MPIVGIWRKKYARIALNQSEIGGVFGKVWITAAHLTGIEIDFIFNMHTVHIGFWIYMHQTNFTCTLNHSYNLLKETCQLIVMVTSKRPTATNSIVKGKYKKGNKCWSSWKWAMLKFFITNRQIHCINNGVNTVKTNIKQIWWIYQGALQIQETVCIVTIIS